MNRIEIDTPLVNLNTYIEAERKNKYAAANIKKQQTNVIAWIVKSKRFKVPNGKYNVKITWLKPDNRKDHDNISFAKKFVLDGLVKGGAIKNDNPRYINNFCDIFVVDKSKDYVRCIVELEKCS